MKFNDYTPARDIGWRGSSEELLRSRLRQPATKDTDIVDAVSTCIDLSWLTHDRPYYNVYPIAVDLCIKTSLKMRWGDITFPVRSLAMRFASGHEPLGISSVIARVPSDVKWSTPGEFHSSKISAINAVTSCQLGANIKSVNGRRDVWLYSAKQDIRNEVIQDSLAAGPWSRKENLNALRDDVFDDRMNFLIRLLAFIGLLARGTDLITPAILSSDRDEYDATSDESRKRWLEERSAKRQGRGFDVGRSLEIEKATSPHWRQPHLALFHTGQGRNVPVLKLRSGCVVIPKDMSSVPTGYMGEERLGEEHSVCTLVYRTPVPKKIRFKVMRRDGYRCRLCGLTAEDGVKLHVDHIVPVAKGGKTVEKNLWTLCQPCNSGKSDSDLYITE